MIDHTPFEKTLPRLDDPAWMEVAIRSRQAASTELRTAPAGNVLMTVYSGDVIHVMREVRDGSWIAAKVGYKVGWLDTTYIGLAKIRRQERPPEPTVQPLEFNDWLETATEQAIPTDFLKLQTQEMPAVKVQRNVGTSEVSRIIDRLKGLFARR